MTLSFVSHYKAKKLKADDTEEVSEEDEAAEIEDEETKKEIKKKKKNAKIKLSKVFSDLVTICQSVKFKGFDHAQKKCTFFFLIPSTYSVVKLGSYVLYCIFTHVPVSNQTVMVETINCRQL